MQNRRCCRFQVVMESAPGSQSPFEIGLFMTRLVGYATQIPDDKLVKCFCRALYHHLQLNYHQYLQIDYHQYLQLQRYNLMAEDLSLPTLQKAC